MEEIHKILEENMTEDGYKLWQSLFRRIPGVWNRLTSSTKRHHLKEDGSVPSIAEHTYEMLFAGIKIISMLGMKPKTQECDTVLLAIVLHDSVKYGENIRSPHTSRFHDQLIGNKVIKNKDSFMKIMSEKQFTILEQAVRFHTGKWSTDAMRDFNFKGMNPETFFVHFLDMLSSRNLIKIT